MLRLEDVKDGDVLIADAGFTCLPDGGARTVHEDNDGHLYVSCAEGRHYLNGQISSDGRHLVGLERCHAG